MTLSTFKKALCAGISFIMALSLSACGASENPDDIPMASKENVYRAQIIEIPKIGGVAGNFRGAYPYDGNMLIFMDFAGTAEKAVGGNLTVAATVDYEGVLLDYIELEKPEGTGSFIKFAVSSEDEVYAAYQSGKNASLIKYDGEGKIINLIDLSQAIKNENDFYILDIAVDDNGNFLFSSEHALYAVDKNGKTIFESAIAEGSWNLSIFRAGDGRIFVSENKTELTPDGEIIYLSLKEADLENGGFGAEFEIERLYGMFSDGNEHCDAYFSNGEGLYGYDIETGEKTPAADWTKSGMDTEGLTMAMSMYGVCVFPDESILCPTFDYQIRGGVKFMGIGGVGGSGDSLIFTRLVKLDPSEVPEKKLITLSALYLDYRLKNAIIEFNKTNDEYQAEAAAYTDDKKGAMNDAVVQLNMDLTAGRIPDITRVSKKN